MYEEEETLEEQGYGVLIKDMKKYIKGGSMHGEEEAEESQHHGYLSSITPKFLQMEKIPGVSVKDSLGSKIEALRVYLEKQIGEDAFVKAYSLIQDEKDEDYKHVQKYLGP